MTGLGTVAATKQIVVVQDVIKAIKFAALSATGQVAIFADGFELLTGTPAKAQARAAPTA